METLEKPHGVNSDGQLGWYLVASFMRAEAFRADETEIVTDLDWQRRGMLIIGVALEYVFIRS